MSTPIQPITSTVRFEPGDHPVRVGQLVRNELTGDIGDMVWIGSPITDTDRWQDMYLKVNVWREGAQRIWSARNVTLVLDPDTGLPPERLEL